MALLHTHTMIVDGQAVCVWFRTILDDGRTLVQHADGRTTAVNGAELTSVYIDTDDGDVFLTDDPVQPLDVLLDVPEATVGGFDIVSPTGGIAGTFFMRIGTVFHLVLIIADVPVLLQLQRHDFVRLCSKGFTCRATS